MEIIQSGLIRPPRLGILGDKEEVTDQRLLDPRSLSGSTGLIAICCGSLEDFLDPNPWCCQVLQELTGE